LIIIYRIFISLYVSDIGIQWRKMNDDNPSLVSVQISDEEHALILMFRTMSLKEIIHVMMLNTHLPAELHDRYDHIKNIVNLQFQSHIKFIQ